MIVLIAYMYEIGIRYSFNEQLYSKLVPYLSERYSASITTYIASTYVGNVSFRWKGITLGIKYFNTGEMELRDELGNLIGKRSYSFMGLYFLKSNVKFNIYYQMYESNNLAITTGFFRKFNFGKYELIISLDDLGFATPYVAGISLKSENFLASIGYEYMFGLFYNLIAWRKLGRSFKISIFKTNRYDGFSLQPSLLDGSGVALEMESDRMNIRYMVRYMGDAGFVHTIGLFR